MDILNIKGFGVVEVRADADDTVEDLWRKASSAIELLKAGRNGRCVIRHCEYDGRHFLCAGDMLPCRKCGATKSKQGKVFLTEQHRNSHEQNCYQPHSSHAPHQHAVPPIPQLDRHAIGTRDILLLGEGNFSFAVAFCMRHPWLCSQVVATDICVRRETGRKLGKVTASNIRILEALGVLVGVLDASRLPSGCTFSRVQFNCPCGDHATPIPKVVDRLFAWCRTGLAKGGTVHISCHGNQRKAQQYLMLPSIVRKHGFELHNTNDTLQDRYPGYTATRTDGGSFRSSASHLVTEYVFHVGEAGVSYTTDGWAYTIEEVHTEVVEPQEPWF